MASDSVHACGFFDLNLRMFCSVPAEQILYMKQEQTLELNVSPDGVKPVIRNLEALLTFVQPLKRDQGVQMMEKIHEEYPENINTVENLITIYKDLKRENDSKRLVEKLNKLKADNSKYEEAKIFLEKGYVLLMDMHSETRESPETKIGQAIEELKVRATRGLSSKSHHERETADNTIRLLKQARENMSAIPERCIEETKAELEESVNNFKRGIKLLREVQAHNEKVASEIPVWKHHLGKAFSRIGNTSQTIMKVSVKKAYLNDAVKEFIYCIEHMKKDNHANKIYLARSYAYLGHLFETKRDVIASKQKQSQMDQELGSHIALWKNPMDSFKTSSELAPDDRVMLNRYALTLMHRQTKDDIERKTNLYKALDVLNKSMKNEPVCNWFGYSLRMQVRVKLYKLQCKELEENKTDRKEKQPDQNLLQEASIDGDKCLSLRTTLEDLMNMAETFYLRGINQRERKNVKNRVKDVNQINIALAYLHRAREHHQCCQHSRLYSLLGKCLFDSGNCTQGIENMKIAMTTEPENVKDPNTFGELINFLLHVYQCKKDSIFLGEKKASLRDILCILQLGGQKYKTRFRFPLIGAVNKYPHEFIDVLEYVVRNKKGYEMKPLVDQILTILKRHNGQRVKQRALYIEQKMPADIDEGDDVSPASPEPETADMENPDQNQRKKFDFYVCHSDQDADWVQTILLPGLQKDWKGDCIFRGCSNGYPRGLEFKNILGDVKVFLFILTPNFEKNERCTYELSTLLKISIDEPGRIPPACLVPIQMDEKCMPDELRCHVKMDFTDCNYDWQKLRLVLTRNINGVQAPEPNRAESEDNRDNKLAHRYVVTMATGMANPIEKNGETLDTEHLSNSEAEQELSADYPANERPPFENEAKG